MALPDRFEQVGIVVGSVILVALPVSALVSALFGIDIVPWLGMLVWVLPGLIVGGLLAAGWLPVTYHQVWAFSLSSWLLAFAGWTALGLSIPSSNSSLSVTVWVIAVVLGLLVAWAQPVSTIRGHFRPA